MIECIPTKNIKMSSFKRSETIQKKELVIAHLHWPVDQGCRSLYEGSRAQSPNPSSYPCLTDNMHQNLLLKEK